MQYWNAVLKLAITEDMGLAIKKLGVNQTIVLSISRFYLMKCCFEFLLISGLSGLSGHLCFIQWWTENKLLSLIEVLSVFLMH